MKIMEALFDLQRYVPFTDRLNKELMYAFDMDDQREFVDDTIWYYQSISQSIPDDKTIRVYPLIKIKEGVLLSTTPVKPINFPINRMDWIWYADGKLFVN